MNHQPKFFNIMTPATLTSNTSGKSQRIAGWVLSGIVILFLLFDAVIKFAMPPEVLQATVNELGFQVHHIGVLGITGLIGVLLYAFPKTSVLGAVLIMGQLGGAVAAHVRVDNPLFSHTLFPVYVGIIMWAGLWLRMPSLRRLFPYVSE